MQNPDPGGLTHLAASSLTSFDWTLVVLLVLSTLSALRRGLIRVAFSVAGLIAGLLLASWNYLALASRVQSWITSVAAAEVVSFLFILLLIWTLFSVAAGLLRKGAAVVGLGLVDRLLGGVFGFGRGLLLGVAVMIAASAFFPRSPWLQNSQLAPYFLAGAHAVSFVVPEHLRQQIVAGGSYLLQQTPELLRPHTTLHRW